MNMPLALERRKKTQNEIKKTRYISAVLKID